MREHPSKKELTSQVRYTTVQETYKAAELGDIKVLDKDLQWLGRKQYRSHFRDRFGAQSDVHKSGNNTPGLYDGSAEARYIIEGTIHNWEVNKEDIFTKENLLAIEVLFSALDYLKGKDLNPNRFSFTKEFFTDLSTWVEELSAPPATELVQIEIPKVNNELPETGC